MPNSNQLRSLGKYHYTKDRINSIYAIVLLIALGISVLPKTTFHIHQAKSSPNCKLSEPEFITLIGQLVVINNCEKHEAHFSNEIDSCELCDFAFKGKYIYSGIFGIKSNWYLNKKGHTAFYQWISKSVPSSLFNKGSPILLVR